MNKKIKILFWLLIIAWLIISSYLTFLHYSDTSVYCPTWNVWFQITWDKWNSCDKVLQSDYAVMFWIPTALFGVLFYIFIGLMFLLSEFKKNTYFKNILFISIIIWLLKSIHFTYLQFFVIKWFCLYCLSSAIIILILFFIILYFLKKK